MQRPTPETLAAIGNQLRILSIQSTTAAGSGHPTTCCSAADLVAALFFSQMRFDPAHPKDDSNDRFILSKGHAAPLLYAAWAETGHFPIEELMTLRKVNSPFEGHPTPRLDFVDVATGSLGQGLSAGLGMAFQARMDHLNFRTYVLLGDAEMSEGSVWEAISLAGTRKFDNLIAIVDVNGLGQSQPTPLGKQCDAYRRRFEAFGWESVVIDGHDTLEIQGAFERIGKVGQPFAIVAQTVKGKGIPFLEDKVDWHGKPLSPEQAKEAIAHLTPIAKSAIGVLSPLKPEKTKTSTKPAWPQRPVTRTPLPYRVGQNLSPRKAFGNALARMGEVYPTLIVLDGDVENSTYTTDFHKKFPDRFIECYIAEQNMIGISQGLSARGKTPCASTFAAFFSRAVDQIRMSAISFSNLKLAGTHAGVSIGEDGPSQMGLEDIAIMRAIHGSTVFSPCDAVSTERVTELMFETCGIIYLRASRAESPIIYASEEDFEVGGAKILRQSDQDTLTLVATGVTVFEALKAAEKLAQENLPVSVIDAYCIKPLASELILKVAQNTGLQIVTVEDHYAEGGLGDTVAGELSQWGVQVTKLAVRELPSSGKKDELLAKYRINSDAIIETVHEILEQRKQRSPAA